MRRAALLALLVALLAAAPALAADPRRGEQWNLDLIEAGPAHAASRGAGAVVAVIDSGVQAGAVVAVIDSGVQADHPDLAGRIGLGYEAVERDASPQDGDGHGTHVLGIVGAASANGIGVESVAPAATLMRVRVLGADGSGDLDDAVRGIDWARQRGAAVIKLPLGREVPLARGAADPCAVVIGERTSTATSRRGPKGGFVT